MTNRERFYRALLGAELDQQPRPSRRFEDFTDKILRRSAMFMPLPGPPHGQLPGIGDYGGGGSSGGGVASAAMTPTVVNTQQQGNSTPWVFPSSDFLNFMKYGSVALPASGAAPVTILSFKVPNGRYGKISAIGADFVANGGAAFTQGVVPAELSLTLAADGVPFQDLGQFNYLPGASASNPLAIAGLMIREGQLITLTVSNLTIVASTQFVEALVTGYYYSKNLQPKGMGYQ